MCLVCMLVCSGLVRLGGLSWWFWMFCGSLFCFVIGLIGGVGFIVWVISFCFVGLVIAVSRVVV